MNHTCRPPLPVAEVTVRGRGMQSTHRRIGPGPSVRETRDHGECTEYGPYTCSSRSCKRTFARYWVAFPVVSNRMQRVLGYVRVSTEEQANSGAGLAAQKATI